MSGFSDLFITGLDLFKDRLDPSSYLLEIPAIRSITHLDLTRRVTFFVGENGTGKSTLLEAMAVNLGFNPEGGTRNYSFSTFDSHSDLCDAIRLVKGYKRPRGGYFLRAESFLALVRETFRGNGIYLLEEPEAALSPQRQLTLLIEIERCVESHPLPHIARVPRS